MTDDTYFMNVLGMLSRLSHVQSKPPYRTLTPREAVPPVKGHKRKHKGSKAAKRASRKKR